MFLAVIGGSIADVLGWFGSAGIGSLVSESYMNGKPRLTQYYLGQNIRFDFLTIALFFPLILTIERIMPVAYVALGMGQYVIAAIFIIPRLIRFSIERFFGIPGTVMTGANKPNVGIYLGIIHSILALLIRYLIFVYWAIPSESGLEVTIYLMELSHLPMAIVISGIGYMYVHKKIVKIKVPWKQLTIGMIIPAVISYALNMLVKTWVFDPLVYNFNFFIALVPTVLLIAIILLFGYFPLTALFGAWDNTNIEEFRKAAQMSGPSKFLVIPIYKIVNWSCNHSKLHNRFGMPTEDVIKDAVDLLAIKKTNRNELREKLMKE